MMPSNDIVYDTVNHKLWYRTVQPASQTWEQWQTAAQQFRAGGIGNWRLAQNQDLDQLFALVGAPTAEANASDMAAYGFESNATSDWADSVAPTAIALAAPVIQSRQDVHPGAIGWVFPARELLHRSGNDGAATQYYRSWIYRPGHDTPVWAEPNMQVMFVKDVAPGSLTAAELVGFPTPVLAALGQATELGKVTYDSTQQKLSVQGTFQGAATYDLTGAVYWTSDSPSIASVSNISGQEGLVMVPEGSPGGKVTFTASLLGASSKLELEVAQPGPAALKSALISPHFADLEAQEISLVDPTAGKGGNAPPPFQLSLTVQKTNGFSAPVAANQVTWTADPPGTVLITPLGATVYALVAPVSDSVPARGSTVQVTITGSYQGQTDSATYSLTRP